PRARASRAGRRRACGADRRRRRATGAAARPLRARPSGAARSRSLARGRAAAALARRRRRRGLACRRGLALELVEAALDRLDALVQRLEASHALLQVVQPVARPGHRGEHAVAAPRVADALDRLLAEVGEPVDDALLGLSHPSLPDPVYRSLITRQVRR